MKSRLTIACIVSLAFFPLLAGPAQAHSGGLDEHGCHHDYKQGGYHCHQGLLAGQAFTSKQEMIDRLQAQAPAPKDLPLQVQIPHPAGKYPRFVQLL